MKVKDLVARLLECDQEAEAIFESEGQLLPVDDVSEDYQAVPMMKRGVTEDTSRMAFQHKRHPRTYAGWTIIGPPRPAICIE